MDAAPQVGDVVYVGICKSPRIVVGLEEYRAKTAAVVLMGCNNVCGGECRNLSKETWAFNKLQSQPREIGAQNDGT